MRTLSFVTLMILTSAANVAADDNVGLVPAPVSATAAALTDGGDDQTFFDKLYGNVRLQAAVPIGETNDIINLSYGFGLDAGYWLNDDLAGIVSFHALFQDVDADVVTSRLSIMQMGLGVGAAYYIPAFGKTRLFAQATADLGVLWIQDIDITDYSLSPGAEGLIGLTGDFGNNRAQWQIHGGVMAAFDSDFQSIFGTLGAGLRF